MDIARSINDKVNNSKAWISQNPWSFFECLLWAMLVIQLLGYRMDIFANGSPLAKFAWIELGMDDQLAFGFDRILVLAMLILAIVAFYFKSALLCFAIAFWTFSLAAFKAYLGGEFMASYSPLALAVRIMLPVSLGLLYWARNNENSSSNTRNISVRLLEVAISLVFLIHGLEALYAHPGFIDFLIYIPKTYLGIEITEAMAKNILILIGVQDILLAAGAVFLRAKAAFMYMTFWGWMTALTRVAYSPAYGLGGTVIRVANGGVPFFLSLYHQWKQKKKKALS